VKTFRARRYARALKRVGLKYGHGENGEPVILTDAEKVEADRLFKKETFNVIASNKVALDRSVPDTRIPK